MLPKILKFGFFVVVFLIAFFISSQNNVALADSCSQQQIGGTYYWICSDGCVPGSASRWYYYYYWNGSSWVWVGWYTVSDSSCAPPPPPPCPTVYCTDPTGFTSSGAGGSCSFNGQTSTAQSCTYICPNQSRVAGHYNSVCSYNSSSQQYCYGSDCSCQPNSPCPTPTPPPCPQITCGGNPGAGGICNYPNSPNVNVGSCTYTCNYPFGPPSYVAGYTISVCQSNNCYANSCQCYPSSPCPACPTITCGTNSGAGGVCNYGSSGNSNVSGCTATCPNGTQVPGYSISVCQTNNCYYNSCACYPNPGACNNGATKTQSICDSTGQWVQQSQACVQNTSCLTGTTISTPIPTPQPNCNSNPICTPVGTCPYACSTTNSNVRTCTYTGPPGCKPTGTFTCGSQGGLACPDNSPAYCQQLCPNNFTCDSQSSCQSTLSISGNVFVDTNVNTLKDVGESNYTGSAALQLNNNPPVSAVNGVFTFSQLLAGSYTVKYTNPPTGSGYSMTYPVNVPPPSLTVSVGNDCTPDPGGHWGCLNGSVANLNFGITNNKPWIQCQGADCRIDSGFINKVPAGNYTNLNGSGGTPGLIFTGNSTPDFGQGQASTTNWIVGGISFGETYSPTQVGGTVKTSYRYLLSKTTQGNITPTDISTYCGGGGILNCNLQALPHGVYSANGDLNLTGGGFTFPAGQNYVILVNGNLTISERIFVPNGSTAVFSTKGNITVAKTLGESVSSTSSTIEGIYSADQSFTADGNNSCTVGADPRLNIAGSVITNAGGAGGAFQNLRDLCANDISYPSIAFFERVDFILNTPDFLKNANFTYQEIAP